MMSHAITIAGCELPIMDRCGIRVISPGDTDRLHGRADGTFRLLFRANRDKLAAGREYFPVETPAGSADSALLTLVGYLVLSKGLHDERSFRVQRELVANYFHLAPPVFDSNTEVSALQQLLMFHEERAAELRNLIKLKGISLPRRRGNVAKTYRGKRHEEGVIPFPAVPLEADQLRRLLLDFPFQQSRGAA